MIFTMLNQIKPAPLMLRVNILRLWQNGHQLEDSILKCTVLYEKNCISMTNSLKLVPEDPINNESALYS